MSSSARSESIGRRQGTVFTASYKAAMLASSRAIAASSSATAARGPRTNRTVSPGFPVGSSSACIPSWVRTLRGLDDPVGHVQQSLMLSPSEMASAPNVAVVRCAIGRTRSQAPTCSLVCDDSGTSPSAVKVMPQNRIRSVGSDGSRTKTATPQRGTIDDTSPIGAAPMRTSTSVSAR